ncbi:MAG: PilZ domain-containing protein [Bdellovibrionaceae bacterium]|nr:PilZ domain-containing protein [Pseudobdellovibrionaceae bacterium]
MSIRKMIPKDLYSFFLKKKFSPSSFIDNKNIKIKMATTKEEFEAGLKLLHDCYISKKYMTPDPTGYFFNSFALLPETNLIIATFNDKVIGAVYLYKDSYLGLPSDKYYGKINDFYRKSDGKLAEISAVAVHDSFRNKDQSIFLLLMKYVLIFSKQFLQVTRLILNIDLENQVFYESLWPFERRGGILKYPHSTTAFSVFMGLDLVKINLNRRNFLDLNLNTNLNIQSFVAKRDERLKFPVRNQGQVLFPTLNYDLIQHLFNRKTDFLNRLKKNDFMFFNEVYYHLFDRDRLEKLVGAEKIDYIIRKYRVPVDLFAVLKIDGRDILTKITDISSDGCFVKIPHNQKLTALQEQEVSLKFNLQGKNFTIESRIIWENRGQSAKSPRGFGIEFETKMPEIYELAKDMLYNIAK